MAEVTFELALDGGPLFTHMKMLRRSCINF